MYKRSEENKFIIAKRKQATRFLEELEKDLQRRADEDKAALLQTLQNKQEEEAALDRELAELRQQKADVFSLLPHCASSVSSCSLQLQGQADQTHTLLQMVRTERDQMRGEFDRKKRSLAEETEDEVFLSRALLVHFILFHASDSVPTAFPLAVSVRIFSSKSWSSGVGVCQSSSIGTNGSSLV
jgi:hypothetical protein